MSYKEIFDTLLELNESYTLIHGVMDIVNYKDISYRIKCDITYDKESLHPLSKESTKDDFWILSGKGDNNEIFKDLLEYDFEVQLEGEYEFKALLKYNRGEYDGQGIMYMPGYYEVVYMETRFIQTFEARDREEKLNQLFSDDINDLFF